MEHKNLREQIENATAIISAAEAELASVVAADESAPTGGGDETEAAVQAAHAVLKTAEATLVDLEAQLVAATHADASDQLDAARVAVKEAEQELDRVVTDMDVGKPLEDAWVSEVVSSAFTKLRTAKQGLAKLETLLASTDSVE